MRAAGALPASAFAPLATSFTFVAALERSAFPLSIRPGALGPCNFAGAYPGPFPNTVLIAALPRSTAAFILFSNKS